VLSKKSALEFFCFSHDISTTGILLETEHQLDLGSRIHCQFNLPDSCLIETEGEVVRMLNSAEDLHLYGVKFIGLAPSYRRAIETYVNLAEIWFTPLPRVL
jgi:c-di-GMP-binding flagellar brake protein YcgR